MQGIKTSRKVLSMRFYGSIIFVLCILIGIIGFSYYIGNRMVLVYNPLIDATMEIKLEATTAHLWFEEIISGDRHEDMNTVWEHIDQADWYAKAMLEGGENQEGTFISLNDTTLRNEIVEVRSKIEEFREITHERYITIESAQAGTDIDKKYDAIFRDFIQQADEVETKLQQIMAAHFLKYKRVQIGLVFLVLLIITILIIVFTYFERIRRKDYLSILTINSNLKKEVSERKQAEKILKESKDRLSTIIHIAPTGIGLVIDRVLQEVNDVFCNMLGYSKEELIGRNVIFIYPDKEEYDFVGEVKYKQIREKGSGSIETRLKRKDGQIVDVLMSSTPLDRNDLKLGVTFTVLDITDRKRHEKEIKSLNENLEKLVTDRTSELEEKALNLSRSRQALTFLLEDVNDIKKQLEISNHKLQDANKELEAFSYSVSHDLKAPLRAVIGFSQILKEDFAPQLDSESNRYIGLIQDNAENMGTLINDLLNFSRMARAELKKTKVDLSTLVQRVKSELVTEIQDRELSINVLDMPLVNADEKLIYHVMLNLISNAVKFTGKVKNAVVEIGCTREKNENVFYIKDNGVGFNMKYAEKIFDVFQRLHTVEEFSGTGIGLSIVQRIIHKHKGRIWVESEINKGTTFFFTL